MSNVDKKDKKDELHININISFLKKIKNFFKKIDLNSFKDNGKKESSNNKSIKKYIYYIVFLLLILFVLNYSYNHYFYYKISKPYSDDIFVYDEYVDTVFYATEKGLKDDNIFKVFAYGNANEIYDKNKTLALYVVENGELEDDKVILEEQKKLEKKGYKMGVNKISEKMFGKYIGNYDGKISPYKTKNFKKLDSNVSDKTILALFSTKYDLFKKSINEASILKGLFNIDSDEKFEFDNIMLTFDIDEKNDSAKILLKFDLFNEFTSDRELSIFTKSIRSISSLNDNIKNFKIDYSYSGKNAEVEISFNGLRNFISGAKDDGKFFSNYSRGIIY